MILVESGSIFEVDVNAIVNPVNTVGVMGKGLALEFKNRYPKNFEVYRSACIRKEVRTGRVFVTRVAPEEKHDNPNLEWIVNFPTKNHWKDPSEMGWIIEGLIDLRRWATENDIQSIAMPSLGSGLGGLKWDDVLIEVEKNFDNSPIEIIFFKPKNEKRKPGIINPRISQKIYR